MKRILFLHSHTLHAKVTIPLALCFACRGYKVSYLVNRPTFFGLSFGFSAWHIRANPTAVGIINPAALRFVARLIGYEDQWREHSGEIRYVQKRRFDQFDGVVATTKDIAWLRSVKEEYGIPAFALGYQHIPFVVKVDDRFSSHDREGELSSIFLADNAFSREHRFREILQACGLRLCGFTYLDKVYWSRGASNQSRMSNDRFVLIFHPGGYRSVISEPGDPKAVCYAKQKAFVERLCIPLLRAGFRTVLKIHPLRAKFHDLADMKMIISDVEREKNLSGGSIICLEPESWYWDYAFRSSFILTFGSSSIYELWSAGLRNVFVCGFEGSARSQKFQFFESIFIHSYDDYLDFVKAEGFRGREFDPLTLQVFEAYHALFNGQATETAYQLISKEL